MTAVDTIDAGWQQYCSICAADKDDCSIFSRLGLERLANPTWTCEISRSKHRTGRQRRPGADETAAGRDADPSAGAGASVEADAGEGGYRSAGEMADAEGVTRSFVNRLLRLTLLAPDIVEAIPEGRRPKGLLLEQLTDAIPSEWDKQREAFLSGGA